MSDIDARLREDVHLLGELLGNTIREQYGDGFLDKIEQIRKGAKADRRGAGDELSASLNQLQEDELLPVARAFNQFLNLANIAEQYQLIHRRDESQPAPFEARVLPELLARLQSEGHSDESLARQLARLEIELVLTAHPTEVARRTLIQKYDAIAAQLALQDHRDLTTAERQQIRERLQRLIVGGEWLPLWEEAQDDAAACAQLEEAGFADAPKALKQLASLRASPQLRAMQRLGRERLDAFIPRLLAQAVEHANPDLVLERVLPLVEKVARRSAYLVLLTENPDALRRLLTLCAASPWIAEQITRFPLLLDELLNEGRLFKPPLAPELAAELRERLTRIPEDDLEQQMEALRNFKLAHRLRVAASEIAGSLPLMKVSDYLTWLAEAILERTAPTSFNGATASSTGSLGSGRAN